MNLVRPPLQVYGIEGRYINALFSAASKTNSLPAVEKHLSNLENALVKDPQLLSFCLDPSILRTTKVTEFTKVLDRMQVTGHTKDLLLVLTEQGRLPKIMSLLKKFSAVMSAHRGETKCVVCT